MDPDGSTEAASLGDPPGFDMTNLRLVSGLTGVDRTLFDLGVFPIGGVGHQRDNSLPYDDFDPVTAAVETVRAQVMRYNVDSVMGVIRPLHSTSGRLEIVVDSRVLRP